MPMMIVCDKVAYMPGQLVTGHVVIISKSPQKVKGLTMRFIGRSSKLFGEMEGTKRYKKEVYFDEKQDIFGHDGSTTQLRVGETLYPFTFSLPPGLPSSFEWSDGNVLYFVEAKLTRVSWKDKRATTRLQVEGVYDLNLEPSTMTPVEVKRQKYVKHLLSKSGPYGFTFKCSRSGFVKGHSLPFSIEIRNLSKVDSRKVRISLLQEVKVSDAKSHASLVEQMKGPAVTAGEVVTWEARLKVPGGIPPTNLGNVLSYPTVVPVLYFLHIQLSLKNCREEPICIKMPVTIATIPMQRRALSVPSLEGSGSNYFPYTSNGHRMDCPMSSLMLPSPAISTSQFSPHLVSSTTHSPKLPGSGRPPPQYHNHHHHHTYAPRSQRPSPMSLLGPVRQYEYYFEYEDSSGTNRSVTSRGEGHLLPRRRHNNYGYYGRPSGRLFIPSSHSARESPPPSYDEIFTRGRASEHGIINSSSTNDNNSLSNSSSMRRILPDPNPSGQEMIHKRVLSAQLSSPSSLSCSGSSQTSSSCASEDEEDSSLSLVLPLSNDTTTSSSSNNNSGRVTPESSSSDSEDDEVEEEDDEYNDNVVVSANDEFISCSGSSSSFEKFKLHDLQISE